MAGHNQRLYIYFLILVSSALTFFLNIYVLKIPVFADGTQHVWLTDYVYKNGFLPEEDITGIQPSNFSIPFSIKNSQPMLYPPLFYILSGTVATFVDSPKLSVEILNLVPILVTSLFMYLLGREILGQTGGILAFLLVVLSHIWPWFTVHRLVEPTIVMLSISAIYFSYKYYKGGTNYLYVLIFNIAMLFGVKQTVYPILAMIFFVVLSKKRFKEVVIFVTVSALMIIPIYHWVCTTSSTWI
jgi:4-amino-4-deoxy-L-arabinose transferase-like glycosyltransferase